MLTGAGISSAHAMAITHLLNNSLLPAACRQSDASQQAPPAAAGAAGASQAPHTGLPPAAPAPAAAGPAGSQAGWSDQACLDYAAQHFPDFDRTQAVADLALFKGRQQVLYKVSMGSVSWRCLLSMHLWLCVLLSGHVPRVGRRPCGATLQHCCMIRS